MTEGMSEWRAFIENKSFTIDRDVDAKQLRDEY